MVTERDLYEVLGVPRDADDKAIKSAYRMLAMKYHPDRNKEPGAEEKFRELANAYAILHDPEKRAMYDSGGHAGVAGFSPEDLFGGVDFEDIFGGLGFGRERFGFGAFDDLFRRQRGPQRGVDVRTEVALPLETIMTGGNEIVHVKHPISCPDCSGSGAKKGTPLRRCDACGGAGKKVRTEQKDNVRYQQITTCRKCNGRGQFIDQPCPKCNGRGETNKEESLSITIPKGAEEGMVLRVSGRGMPPTEAGGTPGDLHVILRTRQDQRFERHGANLWRMETVNIADAVLGTEISTPTLDGNINIKIPPGTQPDAVLRIRGKGLPVRGRTSRGDILLRVDVYVPEKLSEEERELYERLAALTHNKS